MLTAETTTMIIEQYKRDVPLVTIASEHHVCHRTVTRLIQENGIPKRRRKGVPSKYIGTRMCNVHGDFDVIEQVDSQHYRIKFVDTGTELVVQTSNFSKNLTIRDPYKPSYKGVGYLGDMYGTATNHPVLNTWEKMIERCVKGEDGYSLDILDSTWFNFTTFVKDVSRLEFYDRRINDGNYKWNLDKDILGARRYSKDTCLWIPQAMNAQLGGVYKMIEMGFEIKYPTREQIIQYIEQNYIKKG